MALTVSSENLINNCVEILYVSPIEDLLARQMIRFKFNVSCYDALCVV
jgi:hypothetical protein